MKYFNAPCRFILVILALCTASTGYTQSKKEFNDSISTHLHEFRSGDTIMVRVDTVLLLNKVAFLMYKNSFEKFIRNNKSVKAVIANYENTISVQNDKIIRQEGYYQQVRSKLDSLSDNATLLVDRTSKGLNEVSLKLDSAMGHLTETKALLQKSQELLREEQRTSFARKLKIGLGGFAIGVGITSLLFLIR